MFPCLRRADGSLMLESDDVSLYIAQLAGRPCDKPSGKGYDFYMTVKAEYDELWRELKVLRAKLKRSIPIERAMSLGLLFLFAGMATAAKLRGSR
mmetsp:Transcript_22191/g.61581  ORF Transcript_22191/g.61581 Transcript_22191/m.61581 type:complete len:95 (+) Transcript_22191:3-287(+)